ncbi:hypothetical protein RFI_33496 [Reticulomyxa filosa]|nr:hypothetical protein RFI_33496 [Reticulomyxa filosa]|eukprot:ETO03906.1 hypothetical protein RFI_33496 [Reticulomyxa filosa]
MNSVFTISPSGHNPETFRIWEAMGHGSIPIMVMDDWLSHPCADAFYPIFAFDFRHNNMSDAFYHALRTFNSSQWMLVDAPHAGTAQASTREWNDTYVAMRQLLRKYQEIIVRKKQDNAISFNSTTTTILLDRLVDDMDTLLQQQHGQQLAPFYPVVVLRRWKHLKPFLLFAKSVNWDKFQFQMMIWWHRFVQFKFDEILQRLFKSAPFCKPRQ